VSKCLYEAFKAARVDEVQVALAHVPKPKMGMWWLEFRGRVEVIWSSVMLRAAKDFDVKMKWNERIWKRDFAAGKKAVSFELWSKSRRFIRLNSKVTIPNIEVVGLLRLFQDIRDELPAFVTVELAYEATGTV
jgi:hypothetical protein